MMGLVDGALSSYADQNGRTIWMEYNMQLVEGRVLLTVGLTEYSEDDDEPAQELGEDELTRISEAVDAAFGDVTGDSSEVDGADDGYYEDLTADAAAMAGVSA